MIYYRYVFILFGIVEFCERGSLFTLLQSDRPMDDTMKLKILLGIAKGVLHLHSENIIHVSNHPHHHHPHLISHSDIDIKIYIYLEGFGCS